MIENNLEDINNEISSENEINKIKETSKK